MKCKPTCTLRLNHTGLAALIDTFEDRTERIDAAAMALDLLIGNIDTEKAHFTGPAYKSGAEELERMGEYLRMAYVAAYTVRREVAALNDAFSGLLAAPAPQHGGNQSDGK